MQTGEYLDQFIDAFVRPFRAPNTVGCYRRAFSALPRAVTSTELHELNALQLQIAINTQARRYPRAAQLTFACLSAAMKKAEQLGMVQRSPMIGCIKPTHEATRAQVLAPDQVVAYIVAARNEAAFPLLLLMAVCGLRRGEALGLRWDHVDLQNGILRIDQQRMRVQHGYKLRPLKSRASNRVLPLPAPLVDELSAIRVRAFTGFVHDTTPESLARAHGRTLDRAGLPHVTMHGLRHSMATAAAAQGCPMKILQGILGHSKYELTANLYADHLDPAAYVPYMATLAASLIGERRQFSRYVGKP